jgi:hypothetical protein
MSEVDDACDDILCVLQSLDCPDADGVCAEIMTLVKPRIERLGAEIQRNERIWQDHDARIVAEREWLRGYHPHVLAEMKRVFRMHADD